VLPPAVSASPPVAAAALAAAPAAGAPAVRVHIGRLEVRASLEQAPPPRPGRATPRRDELALGDYLRGRREAS
jgi:hypothetical protein